MNCDTRTHHCTVVAISMILVTSLLVCCGNHQLRSNSWSVGSTPVQVDLHASLKQPVIFTNTGSHAVKINATDPEGNQDVLVFLGPGQTYQADPANVRHVQISQGSQASTIQIKTEYPSKVTVSQ